MDSDNSVKVAVRIRPLIPREVIDMCHVCTTVATSEPQVWLGKDKAFTFDHVFDCPTPQDNVYNKCVNSLVEGCLEGYNATVLAYGQTGSGKTFTMGTGFDINLNVQERGIIPRAVEHLYKGISQRQQAAREKGEPAPEFKVNVQFMELYNEDIFDLLDPARDYDDKGKKNSQIKIHEDSRGDIYTVGVTTRTVQSIEETMQCLKVGALSRTTASTQMNAQSSRSHAIFTLHIKQQRVVTGQPLDGLNNVEGAEEEEEEDVNKKNESFSEFETLTAKFHFVDLAGSERLKRTGATGDRAKEGISINCGLLALGNVISALGDKSLKVSHVPYRNSKLTRLLQDSLGGNSRTLMIACVSPCDRDFMETLNTLKYANRAKNIKNKITVNQDKSSQTINILRKEIQMLTLELMEYKQGKRIVGEDGVEQINDMFHENTMLQTENNNLRTRIKALQETVERLTVKNTELLAEKATGMWIGSGEDGKNSDMKDLIQGYIKEIEELRTKLMESEEMCSQLRKQIQRSQTRLSLSPTSAVAVSGIYDIGGESETHSVHEVLMDAKKDIKNLKKKQKEKTHKNRNEDDDDEKQEERKSDGDEDTSEINGNENEESSDSEVDENETYEEDLAELTTEISIKQKLIEELELSQRRLHMMRQHYEEKLQQLQNRIRETELERDRVLANMGNATNNSSDKVKKVKDEFEKKISNLQTELKKMQSAKKEHAQMMRNQAQYERQLKQLKQEVADMKKAKVRLMTKIKEESQRHKESEQRKMREIAQMKKETRQKENRIRTLEAENRMKENVLRRKHEEVNALRKLAKPMSDKVAGRIPSNRRVISVKSRRLFSPKAAKQKWQHIEKSIDKLVLNKQSVYTVERDMERWLMEREKLSRCLERVIKRRDKAILSQKEDKVIQELEEEVENLKANIDYVHENISECQTSIVQMEETKDDFESLNASNLIENIDPEEAKYFVEKLLNMAVNQSLQVAQRTASVKELEARLNQLEGNNSLQQQLLQHLIHNRDSDLYDMVLSTVEQELPESAASSRSSSPVDSSSRSEAAPSLPGDGSLGRKDKVRRKTATPEELLYAASDYTGPSVHPISEGAGEVITDPSKGPPIPASMVMSHPNAASLALQDWSLPRVTSAPGSLKEMAGKPKGESSPSLRRKFEKNFPPDVSPLLRRKIISNQQTDVTPPSSPPVGRKFRDHNVFSRLTSTTSHHTAKPDRGIISIFSGKPSYTKTSPLVCTHIAEGHGKAVLALSATDDVLFSSSKDRTVKIWDLHTGQEVQSLRGHPDNVVSVRYSEYSRLAFSVSTAFIKVWDVRENPAKCIKTLFSSGQTNSGPLPESASRTLQMPPGESKVNAIELNHYGTLLFSAATNIVRIWDLRRYGCVGKLAGGHQAAVMCMAVDDIGMDANLVVTGSKDHYIKVFEISEDSNGFHPPKMNLEPPHYDGIQSLAISGEYLFSGSRDMCIKKWDLSSQCLVQSINQAHKDWVCSLNFLPNGGMPVLLSSCRGGMLKLWSVENCTLLGELRAHSAPINAIAINSSCVFTASNDHTVRVWRLRNSSDVSPDFSDFGDYH